MNGQDISTDKIFLEKKVKLPAIFLIITAGLGMLLNLINIVMSIVGMGSMEGFQAPGMEQLAPWMTGGLAIIFAVIGILAGVVILFASINMMKMEKWGFSLAGAILAMIPCVSPCCILGLPFGIWAIVVLTNTDVKAAFKP